METLSATTPTAAFATCAVATVLGAFIYFVQSRPSKFRYERSGVINAPPEKIFPYLADFHLGSEWSPYERKDPNIVRRFTGPKKGEGSVMEFEGDSNVGSGKLEILRVDSPTLVEIRLFMTKPMKADNFIQYILTPEGKNRTKFTWAMSGDVNTFLAKLVDVVLNCEKMVCGDFEKGIANLKTVVERGDDTRQ